MSKLSERIQNLTPEQQELLRRRMQREAGQQLQAVPPSAGAAVADAVPHHQFVLVYGRKWISASSSFPLMATLKRVNDIVCCLKAHALPMPMDLLPYGRRRGTSRPLADFIQIPLC